MAFPKLAECLITAQVDGPALTAAAAATCLPAASKYTIPANAFDVIGKTLHIRATGRISCVVTTPGTARFDIRLGGTVVADSLAINLNIVAKVNVNWILDLLLTARAVGAAANLMMGGWWMSEAVVGSPLPTVGGAGVVTLPYNSAPVVGGNFDATSAQVLDCFFTQTVATGSLTLHSFVPTFLNS